MGRKNELRGSGKPNFEKWFTGEKDPIVALAVANLAKRNMLRGVAFVIEESQMGFAKLLLTCRHGLEKLLEPNQRLVLGHRSKIGIQSLQLIGDPIYDSNEESDLAFLTVKDPTLTRKRTFNIPFGDPKVQSGTKFFNVKNEGNPFTGDYSMLIMRQFEVQDREEILFAKRTDDQQIIVPVSDQNRQLDLKRQGMMPHRLFKMVSRPGCSGSPVFDENGILYGLNVKGSEPIDKMGDILACLPVSEIVHARARMEGVISERMSSILT